MTDMPKWRSELAAKASLYKDETHNSRNCYIAEELRDAEEFSDRNPDDIVGLLIDRIEELQEFVGDCPCKCRNERGWMKREPCKRCRVLGGEKERRVTY